MGSFKSNENVHKKEEWVILHAYNDAPTPPPPPPPRGNLNNFIKGVRTLRKFRFEAKIRGVNSVSDEKKCMDLK